MHTRDMIYQLGGVPVPLGCPMPRKNGRAWFVDGSTGIGSDSNTGRSLTAPFATTTQALKMAAEYDTIFVLAQKMDKTDTDPGSYTENIVITTPSVSIIGVAHGRTQGGLPQIKCNTITLPIITVKAPGCYIANLGINGAGSTGGGINIYDNGGVNYSAFGLTVENSHFKNCKCHATHGSQGGAIYWPLGGGWQVLVRGCRFTKNVADIVVVTTNTSIPDDIVIQDNTFSGPAASVDGNIFLKGLGSGCTNVVIDRNVFPCFPALASGDISKQLDLTACVGILSNNAFGCSGKTFAAAGNNVVPTTVFMANNWQEAGTAPITR